ncbi:MAG: hypothetical protein JWR77_2254 [Rhizorhabdus sp.]|nr:hypothetical protein [Rhizorhabdus sp.]
MAHQLRGPSPVTSTGWWAVALSQDLPAGKPLAVKCGDTDLVLFRDGEGKVRALLDQCAHRRAPLSLGTVTAEGLVQCPYHGWRYEGQGGQCLAIPNLSSEEKVPRTYRVPAFAVEEQDGVIHVWPVGDATPDGPAPALSVPVLGAEACASLLIAYPQAACIDLLLDAPDAVLNIPGIAIVNAHRFGDPVLADGVIDVLYAAIPASRRGKGLVSEYPFRVRVRVAAGGGHADVQLQDDGGALLAAATIAFTPVKHTLCLVTWRSSTAAGRKPIGIRATIDPVVARDTVDYVSRLLR